MPQLTCPNGHSDAFDLYQPVQATERARVVGYEAGQIKLGPVDDTGREANDDPYLVCHTCGVSFDVPADTTIA